MRHLSSLASLVASSVRLPAALLVGLALAGCGGGQAPEVDTLTLDDLIGEWTAVSAVYTSTGDRQVDFLANGGSVEITVPPSGLATTRITPTDCKEATTAKDSSSIRK